VDEKLAETPPETLETLARRIDHLDGMVHEVHQFICENKPHLEKALRFLDPAASMRDYLRKRPRPGGRDGGTPVQ
jgi:hypothetical protein